MPSLRVCAVFVAVLAVLAAPCVGRAQATKPTKPTATKPAAANEPARKSLRQAAAECRINDKDAWYKKQYEWFGEPGHPWTNDALRAQLLEATGLPVLLVPPVQLGFEFEKATAPETPAEADMVKRLLALGAVRGAEWPTKTVVGAAGVHAIFLLAHRDTGLGRTVLHHMMEAGPTESSSADVATLEDRLRLVWGRKQIYGTQFTRDDKGNVILMPMEDSAHADLRREDAGLPTLKTGICLAKTRF